MQPLRLPAFVCRHAFEAGALRPASATGARVGGSLVRFAPPAGALVGAGAGSSASPLQTVLVRHATSKAGGSSKNGRDSNPKFLGVKKYGGQYVEPGNIILRQRGQRYGIVDSTATVAFGKDYTIYALKPGYVKFWNHRVKRKSYVEVVQALPAPDGSGALVSYPIVRLKPHEYGELAVICDRAAAAGKPAPAMSEEIKAGLQRWRDAAAAVRSSGGVKAAAAAAAAKLAATSGAPAAPPQQQRQQQAAQMA